MVNKLIDGVSFLKSKFQTDELDEKLNQAVSEQNWQASTQLLHEIANAAYNYEKQQRILAFLWEKLKHKSWKKVLKALHLADFLLKYGPTSLVNSLKENIYEFRNFDNYTLMADGIDRGESIRKQSRALVSLLSDDQFLSDERAKAKQIKDRMANVIGSAAYYGSFSNDGSSMPHSGKKQTTSYESYSASSYNKSPPTYGGTSGGMSFGESVMRTLQQAKKEEKVQTQHVQQKPVSKLNLSKMNVNERKPEQKKNFNAMAMKLVKPPEKKPSQKKSQPPLINSPVKPQQKPVGKAGGKVDIMDIDFLGGTESLPQQQSVNNSSNSDLFDFLGTNNTLAPNQTTQTAPQQKPQQQNNLLNFGLNTNNNGQNNSINQGFSFNQPQNIQQQPGNSSFLYNNSPVPNYNYPSQPPTNQQFSFNQQPQVPPASLSISLTPSQPKPVPSSSSSLIDFSNFREELAKTGHQEEKKSIVEEWNW